jgi:hypothetical protein
LGNLQPHGCQRRLLSRDLHFPGFTWCKKSPWKKITLTQFCGINHILFSASTTGNACIIGSEVMLRWWRGDQRIYGRRVSSFGNRSTACSIFLKIRLISIHWPP